jgi:hypothetical protein
LAKGAAAAGGEDRAHRGFDWRGRGAVGHHKGDGGESWSGKLRKQRRDDNQGGGYRRSSCFHARHKGVGGASWSDFFFFLVES